MLAASELDLKDEDGNYVNFVPEWDDKYGWSLRSKLTGTAYHPGEFLGHPVTMFEWYAERYTKELMECVMYDMSPVFMFHWLKMLLTYGVLEHRETERLQYLKNNPTDGLPPKEATKVLKKSEKVYQDAYADFFKRFDGW